MTLLRAYLFAVVGLCGCLHDGLGVPEKVDAGVLHDLRSTDLHEHGFDLAHPGFDFPPGPDLADPSCTQIASWDKSGPQILGSPTESPFDFVTWGKSFDEGRELSVEIWHRSGTPSTPYSLALPETNYLLCEVCVLVDLNFNAAQGFGSPAFLAVSGDVTVTSADDNTSHGKLDVSGTNVHLVEWDFAGDRPLSHGACFNIASFAMSGTFNGDGGDPPRWK